MAYKTTVSTSAASAGVNAVLALLTSGSVLKVYSSNQPASPDVLPGAGHDLLATLQLSTTPFAPAVAGVAAANPIAASTVLLGGTAAWFRLSSTAAGYPSSSGYGILDGSASTAGSNLVLNSVALSSGAAISVTALTVTLPQTTP